MELLSRDMLNLDFLEKGLGIVSPPHFMYDFSRKMFSIFTRPWVEDDFLSSQKRKKVSSCHLCWSDRKPTYFEMLHQTSRQIVPTIPYKIYWDQFTKSSKGGLKEESLIDDFVRFSCVIANGLRSHCMESVQIRSFFWSIFSCIRTEYSVNLLIQSECRKTRTRRNSVLGHFSRCINFEIFLKCPHFL